MNGTLPPGDREAVRSRGKDIFALILLGLAVAAVFWPLARQGFINFDDDRYVYANEHVLRGLTAKGIGWAFASAPTAHWHPVTWMSHMLDVSLFGERPGWHHLVSLMLHAAGTALLYLWLKALTGAFWPSLAVAFLFAVHPLHVESVAWVSERKDVLSGFMWFAALLAYARYVRGGARRGFGLVVLFFALGLMSKAVIVVLPVILLALDYWPLGRFSAPTPGEPSAGRPGFPLDAFRAAVMEKVPLLVMSAVSAVITLAVSEKAGALETLEGLPMPARLAGAFNGYQWYLRKTFWPSGLSVFYPHAGGMFSPFESAWSAAAVFGLTVLAFIVAVRRPYFLVGWIWYLLTFLPVIGLVQVGVQAVADRYAYLPLTGVFIALAWGAGELVRRRRAWRAPMALLSAALLAALSLAAMRQVSYWRDEPTLYGHGLDVTSDNFVLRYNLGLAFDKSGRHEEALRQFSEALRVKPEWDMAHLSAGRAYYALGRYREALASYDKAVASNPDWATAHHERGMVLFQLGRYAEAAAAFNKAIKLGPAMTEVYNNLGATYVKLNQPLKAIASYNEAIRRDRFNEKAYMNLALLYLDLGDLRGAEVQYEILMRFKPESAGELKAFLDYGKGSASRPAEGSGNK